MPAAGQRFVNKGYAATLRTIATEGASSFYRGAIAPHLEPSHATTLFKRIDPSKASRAGSPEKEGGTQERIGRGTTAFAVADADGNMIAVTQTLSTWGGTFYISGGLGFLYNNHLRFNPDTAPGRFLPLARSSSTSVPTLLFKRTAASDGPGVPALAVAAAGNNWIPASVYNIILNIVDGRMAAQAAIEAPRFLHRSVRTPRLRATLHGDERSVSRRTNTCSFRLEPEAAPRRDSQNADSRAVSTRNMLEKIWRSSSGRSPSSA